MKFTARALASHLDGRDGAEELAGLLCDDLSFAREQT